jgi:hypothetical protein
LRSAATLPDLDDEVAARMFSFLSGAASADFNFVWPRDVVPARRPAVAGVARAVFDLRVGEVISRARVHFTKKLGPWPWLDPTTAAVLGPSDARELSAVRALITAARAGEARPDTASLPRLSAPLCAEELARAIFDWERRVRLRCGGAPSATGALLEFIELHGL